MITAAGLKDGLCAINTAMLNITAECSSRKRLQLALPCDPALCPMRALLCKMLTGIEVHPSRPAAYCSYSRVLVGCRLSRAIWRDTTSS